MTHVEEIISYEVHKNSNYLAVQVHPINTIFVSAELQIRGGI